MPIPTPEEIIRRKSLLNRKAELVKHGQTYRIDIDALLDYQWSDDISSSWFVVAMVGLAKSQLEGALSRHEVLQLVADTIRMTVASLEQTMEWNANYMAMHDGYTVEEMHVWPIQENGAHDTGAIPPSGTPSASLPG